LIRQLRRLTRPLPAASPNARALAVYGEDQGGDFALSAAADEGFEGVACVDDAARAAGLYCTIWRQHGFPWARSAAEGFLRFVMFMQDERGRFANFVLDWKGRKNVSGVTSAVGGWWWTARAMHALGCGVRTFGASEYGQPFLKGWPWLDKPGAGLDVRAICVLAGLEYWRQTGADEVAERTLGWAEEIARNHLDEVLLDVPGNREVHLWGHLQETALAKVGLAFERPDLVSAARDSAEALFVPRVAQAFAAHRTMPYEVSCAVLGLSAVADATGESHFAEQADLAREWFRGRNAAHSPMYDRERGLVHDGIDDGQVNPNSGAESNIEGALALFDSLPWEKYGEGASG
jgi:hypothetical protein